ncbi:MAG: MMPL family transporter [Acidimicrobiales bacterium]|jgi:RND superfamily putative drug exporter
MNQGSLFEKWGRLVSRRRRSILIVALIGVLVGVGWGTSVLGALQSAGGFNAPNGQSQQELNLATKVFGRDAGDVVVLYSSTNQSVSSTEFKSAVTTTLDKLPKVDVLSATTYWSSGSKQFVSRNGHDTFAVLELKGSTDDARQNSYDAIKTQLNAPGLTTSIGGLVPTDEALSTQTTKDIKRAETLSFPILLVLLLLIFGSLTAAGLPLAIGAVGILGSFTALRVLTLFTPVSIFSANITTIMGLGLAIDYGLFMVSRFREELHRQGSVEDAVARTVATAGRTVMFSGLTVAIAMSSLTLFPELFLRSMGYGGILTVLVDMLAALTVMPALLSLLGPKVNSLRIRKAVKRAPVAVESGRWYKVAKGVMRRPIAYTALIVVVLLALGSPFLHVVWGGADATALAKGAPPRVVTEAINRDFPNNPSAPIEALVTFKAPVTAASPEAASLTSYVGHLKSVPGVTTVNVTGVKGDVARIDMGFAPNPNSPQAETIVKAVRDVAAPTGAQVLVGGQSAFLVDTLSSMSSVLPWMLLVVVLATFVMLFLAFGSLVLPLKAIIMNILSLSVMYGVLVWVFQEGHLSGFLHFTANGTLNPATPILMFAVMFGLSMDYEVFLLSRVREHYLATGNNETSVAVGLQKTGGIITSAATLLIIVVGPFSLSSVSFTKLMGVGMIVALVVDATIIRVLLVPATMKLLGRANWWAPGPLRRLHERIGIEESGSGDSPELESPGLSDLIPA